MTLANVDMSQDKSQGPLLQVQDVHTTFNIKQKGTYFWQKPDTLKAVNGVSFELFPGETLGVWLWQINASQNHYRFGTCQCWQY